jgi:hypothetical protein
MYSVIGHGIHTFNDHFVCETLFDVVRMGMGKSAAVGLEGFTGCELLGRFADICGNARQGPDDAVANKIIEISEKETPTIFILHFCGGILDSLCWLFGRVS